MFAREELLADNGHDAAKKKHFFCLALVSPKGKWYDNSVDDQKRGAVMRTGFDHDLYTRMQSDNIRSRIAAFGGKLYLELGGKLFDDFHASRVLPGFKPTARYPCCST